MLNAPSIGLRTVTDMTMKVDDRQLTLTVLADAVDAAPGVLERLAAIKVLLVATAAAEQTAGRVARASGHAWSAIGLQIGISKQAAAQRFGEPSPLPQVPAPDQPAKAPIRPTSFWAVTLPGGRELVRMVKHQGKP